MQGGEKRNGVKNIKRLTRLECNLRYQHPFVREEELDHDKLAMLAMQVDGDVPGVLHHPVRHVDVVHRSVISKLSLLVGEVNLKCTYFDSGTEGKNCFIFSGLSKAIKGVVCFLRSLRQTGSTLLLECNRYRRERNVCVPE